MHPYIRTFPYFDIGMCVKSTLSKVVATLKLLFSLRIVVGTKTRIAKDTFSPLVTIGLLSYGIYIFASNCVNFDLLNRFKFRNFSILWQYQIEFTQNLLSN